MRATLTPFQFRHLPVRGRLLCLPGLSQHVASLKDSHPGNRTLAELLAAAALLAFDAKPRDADASSAPSLNVSLQIQHPALAALLWARSSGGGALKAYANPAARGTPFASLVSQPGGLLVVTLEEPTTPGRAPARYQSIVPLDHPENPQFPAATPANLAAVVAAYFTQSVQTPTHLVVHTHTDATGTLHAGALMLQALPTAPLPDDDWTRLGLLAATLTDTELTDPALPHATLLQRLFAEDVDQEGLELFPAHHPTLQGPDPRPAMLAALAALPPEELAELLAHGAVTLTDETTGETHTFSPDELAGLLPTPQTQQ